MITIISFAAASRPQIFSWEREGNIVRGKAAFLIETFEQDEKEENYLKK